MTYRSGIITGFAAALLLVGGGYLRLANARHAGGIVIESRGTRDSRDGAQATEGRADQHGDPHGDAESAGWR